MLFQNWKLKSTAFFVIISLFMNGNALAEEPIPVVSTFSILGDMVERIGGKHVNNISLVGRNGDAHVYQPTPTAAKAVKEAEILFINGLEFEGWLERLSQASDFDGALVVATKNIQAIAYDEQDELEHEEHEHEEHAEDNHGAYDPHAWLSPTLAITYIDNITAALAQADPKNASLFYQNRTEYVTEIRALDSDIKAMMAKLPNNKRVVITSHDAFQYFGRDYGLEFKAPQGVSTDSEASAKDVARLIEQIREHNISAVFIENIADSRLMKQIANETGAKIGGALYPSALSEEDGPAATYIDLLRHNAETIAKALSSN